MWFKQVTPFRVFELPEAERLKTAIAENWFCSPTGLDWFSEGFCSPVPFGNPIIFEAQKTMLISLMREEKVLPSAAIKHKLDEQVVKIQTAEGRNVGRREKHELREAIIDDLLPKALIKSSRTYGLFAGEWLFVDTANRRKAENMLTKLREALGGLSAQHPVTRQSPASLMTNWLLAGSLSVALAYKRSTGGATHRSFSLSEFKFNNINIDGIGRFGLVWNNSKWYAGMSGIFHAYNYHRSNFSTNNFFGSVNIYCGFNFGRKKNKTQPHSAWKEDQT